MKRIESEVIGLTIRLMKPNELDELCNLTAKRTIDAPDVMIQLEGVEQKDVIVYQSMCAQLSHYLNTGEVWILDNRLGLLAVHHRKNGKPLSLLMSVLHANCSLVKVLSKSDLRKVKENAKQFNGLHNISWRKKLCGKNYYYIDLIVTDLSQKGTGAFRSLIDPLVARSERENTPILLDTFNPENVLIYEHFGFKIMKEYSSKVNPELKQFCMARFPKN